MSNILFANNASTVLAAPISSGATSITLATGTGALLPSPTGAQYFLLTFVDAGTGLLTEIVKVTARSGDNCTIVRAQEGTSARAWLAGDIAANFWTAGSVTALQAGFPISSGSISSNTTLTGANSGTLYRVSGSGTVVSLPAASANSGMVVGFSCQALGGCQIVSLGGVFAGGAVDGNTSVNLAATDFLCVQSNGTIWVIFAASPDILVGGTIALESWVTANFDPLGAAAAAQATAEAYALALAGNLKGVQSVTASTNFTGNDFGWCLRLTAAASGNANFTIDVPVAGSMIWAENNSPTFNITLRTDGTNRFYGYVGAGAYQSGAQATVVVPPQSVLLLIAVSSNFWLVSYNSLSFDTAGAAANALTTAEAFASALQGNLPNVVGAAVNTTFTTADFGKLLRLQSTAAANTTFTLGIPVAGSGQWLQNNSSIKNLTIAVDATARFFGFVAASGYTQTLQTTIVLPPNSSALIWGTSAGSWAVVWNSSAFLQPSLQIAPLTAYSTHGINLVANYSGSVSVTFTAPTNGTVMAFGGINVGNAITPGSASTITLSLKINGSQVDGDFTQVSMSFFGQAAVTAGTSVTVTSLVTVNTVATGTTGSYRVGAIFVPTP